MRKFSTIPRAVNIYGSKVAADRSRMGRLLQGALKEVNLPINNFEEGVMSQSPSEVLYPGDVRLPLTSSLELALPNTPPPFPFPVFRILDEDGHLRSDVDPSILSQNELFSSPEMIHKALVIMTRLRQMDDLFLNAQVRLIINVFLGCEVMVSPLSLAIPLSLFSNRGKVESRFICLAAGRKRYM